MKRLRNSLAVLTVVAVTLAAETSCTFIEQLGRQPFQHAHEAYLRNDYSTAEAFWRADLALIKLHRYSSDEEIEYWCSETWLAKALMKQGRYSEAEPLLNDALEVSKKVRTPGHYVVPLGLKHLADLYRVEGRSIEAMALYTQAHDLEIEHRRQCLRKDGGKITSR